MEWHHTTSPKEKKARTILSAAKVTGTVFYDAEGSTLVDVLPKGETISTAPYIQVLKIV
jgi:hypothetical protein